jgi:N-acetylmuramoyl-L-alanine amidase
MNISKHKLEGDKITFQQSPNSSGKFSEGLPDTIVIHYTAGASLESSVKTLCDPRSKASAHLVVGRDGSVVQLIPFDNIAWHAGKSSYQGRVGLNKYSIGIEIDNAGRLTKSVKGYTSWFGREYPEAEVIEAVHRNEKTPDYWHRYSEEQIQSSQEICSELIESYPISTIVGHEEISPGRKSDPGPAFPLDKLRERVLIRERGVDQEPATTAVGQAGLITANKLNIRSAPSLTAETVAPPLPRGIIVDIVGESEGWYQVELKMKGWVKADYVKR